jgi:hypothetical protein
MGRPPPALHAGVVASAFSMAKGTVEKRLKPAGTGRE